MAREIARENRGASLAIDAVLAGWATPVANDDNKSVEAHLAMKQRMGERDGTGANRTAITSLQVQAKTVLTTGQMSSTSPAPTESGDPCLAGWSTPVAGTPRKSQKAMTSSTNNGRRSGGGNSSPPGLEQEAELSAGIVPKELEGPTMEQTRQRLGILADVPRTGNQGQLNPALSRWLMGYPPSWCVAGVKAYRKIKSTRTRRQKGA
jgi:hypothetical protein